MEKKNLLQFPSMAIFLAESVAIQNPRCIDFTKELESSLGLFQLGALARFFPQIVAGTAALFTYLFFLKAFAKPKTLLALVSLPITYAALSTLISYLIRDVFSYCY
ncbi:MAG: hypothetical protein A2900_00215 [Candidatus Chisholmbacteria bacterium RIFCSPLOWO2_01_FULL_50_28]|uniref:Uncharacterized protein n=1 Tax=Candidatus Chisholmbacteria bacterium RIFCSPHIGHO2_01_FULL_52_32 TaxID=1797591 RepID=A0A1G1VQX8_9BACT|nr:MAG: hypothetical protein A2786_00560 [Candidatus Chisholmbacteria bacterium RIFCSPHIGHO2_01_FULL_52_32]OGY19528.1 MAG: hypothetical protein A2900_00215 [Candidatus Chisholmbacteria bacterium RIFCSPLOWO2_01_FULL_50_28]